MPSFLKDKTKKILMTTVPHWVGEGEGCENLKSQTNFEICLQIFLIWARGGGEKINNRHQIQRSSSVVQNVLKS